jgi:nucleoside-diphosphate-sugar epimerase
VRVFVAGATGVLGRPVVRRLVAAGHEVVGLTRSPERAAIVAALGAEPAVADALDAPALRAAVLAARPHAVLHLLTALSGRSLRRAADFAATNALRTTGTRYLVDAASAAAVRQFVAESMIFAYGYGDHGARPLAEDDPAASARAAGEVAPAVEAMRSLEEQVLAASRAWRLEGIVLRLGILYGPGASDEAVAALRRRTLPLPRGGPGVVPVLHVEDAADAILLALEHGRPGEIYNVAEEEPAPLRELYGALARASGAPPPRRLPGWIARRVAPHGVAAFDTRLAVTSAKARRELGWAPRHPHWPEAIAAPGG